MSNTNNNIKLEEALGQLKSGDLIRLYYNHKWDLGALGSKSSIVEYLGNDDEERKIKFSRALFDIKSITMTYEKEIPYSAITGIEKLEPRKIF